ncbi:YceI family protein [Flavobacterium agricola]|uniref:YceI family protein n=1 Tax=Flavobacterium agricola TaxID=2870839 RepID=A0ABY6LZ92_9FLAO|nr:YceI family protein [Flavobacterium agricola]UYW01640.1 YceI family protein [Flavobacterium agricola]
MKKVFLVMALAVSSLVATAQNFTNDKAHSKLGFSVSHLTISDVEGQFNDFTVHLSSFENQNVLGSKFHVVAEINSINTGIEARDNHLKSADFFDAAKNPRLEFQSKSIKKVKGNNYKLVGDLTLHGVTKSVTLDLIYNGSVDNQGVITYGFTVKGKLNRNDFGVGAGFPTAVVGDEVTLVSNLEFATPKAK